MSEQHQPYPLFVDLSRFQNPEYRTGRPFLVRALWFFVGQPLLRSAVIPSSSLKRGLLRLFGAKVGKGAVIKPGVRVKYPWHLTMGDDCWIGEDSWIDNLADVTLGNNVCLSQGTYFCTGNHDWADPTFGLVTRPIEIHDGAWVAAQAAIGPGVVVGRNAIAGFGAVVTGSIPPFEIHVGNPARFIRRREIKIKKEPQQIR